MSTPDAYAFRALPDDPAEVQTIIIDQVSWWRADGLTWMRVTAVTNQHPKPPYPNGIYFEGWKARPVEDGPFDFPLTDAEPA